MREESSEDSSILLKNMGILNALARLLPMTGDFRQPFTSPRPRQIRDAAQKQSTIWFSRKWI
jgi:hypothetical protein